MTQTADGSTITTEAKTSITDKVGDNSITLDKDGTTIAGDLNVNGDTKMDGALSVTGDSDLQGNVNVGKDLYATNGTSYFSKSIWNEGKKNQVVIDETGIRVGLGSTHMDDDGVYAGGHNWDEAKAAMNSDGRIKGLYADIQNDLTVGGDATVGGTLTTEKLVVNDTFQAQAFAVDGKTYIDSNGLNANNQKITNVAPGAISAGSTDAINGSQLYNIREDLSKDIKKVGAGAAAMANLRPLESGNKFSLALGVGTYRSESAAAIGLFYKPTDRIQFNLSGTVGSGHNMFGGGISFALDKVVKPVGNAAANAEIKSLQAENAEIKAQLEELKAIVQSMKAAAK